MRKMKESGVAWIGKIPETWEVTINKTILKNISERNHPDAEVLSLYRDLGVVPKNSRDDNHNVTSENTIQYKFVEKGSLVINKMKAWQGSLAVSNYEGIVSPAYYVCKFRDNQISKDYVHYLLRSSIYAQQFERLSTGMRIGQWDLSIDDFLATPLLVPPEKEQAAIAKCLDKKSMQIDALIANVQEQIEKLKAYKQSLITEVVTKGLDPNVPMKDSRVDVYPYMPAHWNVQKTLTVLSMPITDGPHTTPELISDGIPFVSAEAVSCGNGKIDVSHIRGYISEEFYNECCKKYIPKLYDIYMIKSGATTGKVSIVDTDRVFTIWSPLAVFRCDPNVGYFKFIFYFLQSSAYQRQVQFGWTYGTQQNIGMRTLERLKIFVPPYNEQVQIAEYLDNKCVQIDQLISIKQSKIEKLEQYKRSLIYEYVTGKKEVS